MSQSSSWLQYLVAAVLIVHGLGHAGGYWMLASSWAGKALTRSPMRWLFIGLWLIAMLGFIASGIGLLAHQSWWSSLALLSAFISLPAVVLFFRFNLNLVGALLVDAAVIASLLWLLWPALEALSR